MADPASTLTNINLSTTGSLKAATSYTSTSLHEAVKLRLGTVQGVPIVEPQTIPQLFRECCHKYAHLPALQYEVNETTINATTKGDTNKWTTLTYEEYYEKVEQAALILLHIGLQPRSSVGILAFNCPEWFYTEFGAMRAGGVVAGIYPSNSAEAVYHVLDTSDATVCIVDDAQQMAKVHAVKSRLPRLRAVVQLYGPYDEFVGIEEGYYRWEDLTQMQFNVEHLRVELEHREREVYANECALLIYTSGTVGMPKGVMISHDAIVYDAKGLAEILKCNKDGAASALSYLPLNHIAAQIFDIFISILWGACVTFADRDALKGNLTDTLVKVRPTSFFSVPRVFEKIQEKFATIQANSSSTTRFFMNWSRAALEHYHLDLIQGRTPSSIKYWIASKVAHQIKVTMGLDRCRNITIGGAPVSCELKRFFLGLDLILHDTYGLSETSGAIAINLDNRNLKSVGKVIDGVEVKIFNPDGEGHGEVCLRGRTILMGYLNDEGKTKEILQEDGWFHTGDIGYLDSEGYLIISGRIKEILITAGGENIPPVRIEQLIKNELPAISNALVVGDRRKYLTVLLTIRTDVDDASGLPLDTLRPETLEWLRSLGLQYTLLSEVLNIPVDLKDLDASNVIVKPDPKVVTAIEEAIKRANAHAISNAQKVQKFTLLPHDFSLPTGEIGPTLKVRRNIVLQKYASVIEKMYK